jgi:hypothetical protein
LYAPALLPAPPPRGIDSGLRAEDERLCALVVGGVNARGEKKLLAIEDGVRESNERGEELTPAARIRVARQGHRRSEVSRRD